MYRRMWLVLIALLLTLSGCKDKPLTFNEGVDAYKAGDFAKAYKSFEYNANTGEIAAMYNLGVLYYQGKGAPKDPVKAAEWFKKAGEKGHVDALASLGVLLYTGEGVNQNKAAAASVFELAAQRGHVVSMNTLGEMLLKGDGIAQNLELAKTWLQKAAENKHPKAPENLAILEGLIKEQETAKEQKNKAKPK